MKFTALLAAFFYGTAATNALQVPSNSRPTFRQIEAAFASDGWNIADSFTTKRGHHGYFAQHKHATILDNGEPKKAYYLEGDGYDMGYLHGALSARIGDAYDMCTTYVHHIIVNLLSEQWDEDMAAKCEGWVPGVSQADQDLFTSDMSCDTYETLLNFMEAWLITGTVHSYRNDPAQFPAELEEEMHGFVAGALAEDPNCGCTYEKMIYVNYGIDFIMGSLYAGQLPRILSEQAQRDNTIPRHMAHQISEMAPHVFKIPYFCNAFGAVNGATTSGKDIYMGRDFQLPTGLVYQTVAADIIYNPTDGRLPHISSGAPMYVGRVTGMNKYGVTMGIDMLRAAPVNPAAPGLNSILLTRHVMEYATSTRDAIDIIANAPRGMSWLYPICDANADCVIIEAGKHLPKGEYFNPLQYVNNSDVLALLPDQAFLDAHSSNDIFNQGIYVRSMNWTYPEEYLGFNEALYELAGMPYDASLWGATGQLFESFEDENDDTKCCLHNNFFPPQRETFPDIVIISNNAIVPEYRISMMSYAANFWEVTAHAAQWRYDQINDQLTALHGKINMETAKEVMNFLSPARTPGYWTNTINENPMSAIVEGTMNIADIRALRLTTKTGYWSDPWTELTLSGFLSMQE